MLSISLTDGIIMNHNFNMYFLFNFQWRAIEPYVDILQQGAVGEEIRVHFYILVLTVPPCSTTSAIHLLLNFIARQNFAPLFMKCVLELCTKHFQSKKMERPICTGQNQRFFPIEFIQSCHDLLHDIIKDFLSKDVIKMQIG